jgi:hypothetical protein
VRKRAGDDIGQPESHAVAGAGSQRHVLEDERRSAIGKDRQAVGPTGRAAGVDRIIAGLTEVVALQSRCVLLEGEEWDGAGHRARILAGLIVADDLSLGIFDAEVARIATTKDHSLDVRWQCVEAVYYGIRIHAERVIPVKVFVVAPTAVGPSGVAHVNDALHGHCAIYDVGGVVVIDANGIRRDLIGVHTVAAASVWIVPVRYTQHRIAAVVQFSLDQVAHSHWAADEVGVLGSPPEQPHLQGFLPPLPRLNLSDQP